MSYEVDVLDEVKNEDIPALPGQALKRAAAELLSQLYVDPRLGEPMRERFNHDPPRLPQGRLRRT